jgi:nicotinamide riboside kinase
VGNSPCLRRFFVKFANIKVHKKSSKSLQIQRLKAKMVRTEFWVIYGFVYFKVKNDEKSVKFASGLVGEI